MAKSCFYHENALKDNIALYRVKYVIGLRPELIDTDRDLCDICYNFLTKKMDIIKELADLCTIRERHPRFIYMEPGGTLQSTTIVWRAPNQSDLIAERHRLKNEKKIDELFSII